jgi:hypothetical protein
VSSRQPYYENIFKLVKQQQMSVSLIKGLVLGNDTFIHSVSPLLKPVLELTWS